MSNKIIHVLNQRVALEQPSGGFQTSIDAVLLAAAAPVKAGQRILDLGCGVGAAGLCVGTRVNNVKITGVELLEREADLAAQNAKRNQIDMNILCQDVRDLSCASPDDRYDHVVCNPPYLPAGAHLLSPDAAKARAMGHVEDHAHLKDWLDSAHKNLKSNGSLTMIHRADELDKIITGINRRFGALEIIPLWPKQGRAAKRVIIRAIKDRQTPLVMHAGLVLHQENGDYTDTAQQILRDMQPLYQ